MLNKSSLIWIVELARVEHPRKRTWHQAFNLAKYIRSFAAKIERIWLQKTLWKLVRFFCSLLSKSEGVFFFFSFLFFFPASEDKDFFSLMSKLLTYFVEEEKTFRNFKGTNEKFHFNQNKKQLLYKVAKAIKTLILKYQCILYYSNNYGWIQHKANKQLSSSNKKVL